MIASPCCGDSRTRRLHWRAIAAQRPDRWQATATMDDGSCVRLRYDFAADRNGTVFTRTLDYPMQPLWLRVVDALFGRFRIRRESAVALSVLQQRFARGDTAAR